MSGAFYHTDIRNILIGYQNKISKEDYTRLTELLNDLADLETKNQELQIIEQRLESKTQKFEQLKEMSSKQLGLLNKMIGACKVIVDLGNEKNGM